MDADSILSHVAFTTSGSLVDCVDSEIIRALILLVYIIPSNPLLLFLGRIRESHHRTSRWQEIDWSSSII